MKTIRKIHVVDESKVYRLCINPFGELVFEDEATIKKVKELGLSLRAL